LPDNKVHSGKTPGFLAKLRKIFGLNIGTVMFGAIFIYMIFSVILYLTASHMESYQVPSGPLSMNETYTGLAIMTENVVQADAGGYVTYYAREGTKINANGAVYSLNSSRSADNVTSLSREELASAIRMTPRNLQNRKNKPDMFQLGELEKMAKKLKITITIGPDGTVRAE